MRELRTHAAESDLILISTPEYAHGIPGILKNALEWMFYEGTVKKRVAVLIGSAQGTWVRDQLQEVLTTMDFVIGADQFFILSGARSKISPEGEFIDPNAKKQFETFCTSL